MVDVTEGLGRKSLFNLIHNKPRDVTFQDCTLQNHIEELSQSFQCLSQFFGSQCKGADSHTAGFKSYIGIREKKFDTALSVYQLHSGAKVRKFHQRELREKEKKLRRIIQDIVFNEQDSKLKEKLTANRTSMLKRIFKTPLVIVNKWCSYFSSNGKVNYFKKIRQAQKETLMS